MQVFRSYIVAKCFPYVPFAMCIFIHIYMSTCRLWEDAKYLIGSLSLRANVSMTIYINLLDCLWKVQSVALRLWRVHPGGSSNIRWHLEQTYSHPLGPQVPQENDPFFASVFWTQNGATKGEGPLCTFAFCGPFLGPENGRIFGPAPIP